MRPGGRAGSRARGARGGWGATTSGPAGRLAAANLYSRIANEQVSPACKWLGERPPRSTRSLARSPSSLARSHRAGLGTAQATHHASERGPPQRSPPHAHADASALVLLLLDSTSLPPPYSHSDLFCPPCRTLLSLQRPSSSTRVPRSRLSASVSPSPPQSRAARSERS